VSSLKDRLERDFPVEASVPAIKNALEVSDIYPEQSPLFTGTGITVTPESAMKVSSVYACVRILAETVASLPLKIYEEVNGNQRVASHPLNRILGATCNGEQTALELREFQMSNLGLRGNAYAHITRDGRGVINRIDPLKTGFMLIYRDASNELMFDYREPGNEKQLRSSQVWRIAGLSGDGVTGLSPISLARESIGVAMATESTASRLFSNGVQTSGTLEFDHKLDADQIENLRTQFAENYAGHKNAHKPLILESGMKFAAIGMNMQDSQFLESRKFQIAEIARWYRVPLHMLNELSNATFSNIEHQSIEFVMHTIRPWLVRIEQSINRDLLRLNEQGRYFAKHNVEGLLRGDTKSRYEAYGSAIDKGWMNRNEVRTLEGMNKADGLDEYLVPLNMTQAGQTDIANRLATAEIKTLTIEAERKTLGEFAEWLPEFYARHSKRMVSEGGASQAAADDYTNRRIEGLYNFSDAKEAIDSISQNIQKEIEEVIA
jgi:HK97 family phage portal protein